MLCAWAQILYGAALARSSPESAIDLLAPLLPMWRSAQSNWMVSLTGVPLGESYLHAGRLEEAQAILSEAIEAAGSSGLKFLHGSAHRLCGEVLLETGELEAARRHFTQATSSLEKCKAENEIALVHADFGRLNLRQGATGAAREHFTSALQIFDRLGTLQEPARVRAELPALATP